MADITTTNVIDINDKKVLGVAKRVLHTVIISSEKAVASQMEPNIYKVNTAPNGLEQIFLDRFNSFDAAKKQVAGTKVMTLVKAPQTTRKQYFDDLSSIDLKVNTPVIQQVNALQFPVNLKIPSNYFSNMNIHGGLISHGLIPMQVTNKLELRIHRVKCVDETNPEWPGDDEIALGGSTVDETGDVNKVPKFTVRNDFDDGEVKVYSPLKRFTSFSLLEGTQWPKCYFVTFVLAEVDMGGLAEFLNKLVNAIKEQVISALTAALGAAIGSSVGPIGALIGAVVGWIVGKIFEWLRAWWSDDIFPPRTVSICIPSLNARWPGGKTDSPEHVVRFTGHGGTYDLIYDWRLYS